MGEADEGAAVTIQEEARLFESKLPSLLEQHRGEFVLFKGGEPIDFFPDAASAYGSGLDRFGLDTDFLVTEVTERRPLSVSIAWSAGVMVGWAPVHCDLVGPFRVGISASGSW